MNLSDNMVYGSGFAWKYHKKKFPYKMWRYVDLKRHIRLLKNDIKKGIENGWEINESNVEEFIEAIIDKRFGKELIE